MHIDYTLHFSSLSNRRVQVLNNIGSNSRVMGNATERDRFESHDQWEQWRESRSPSTAVDHG